MAKAGRKSKMDKKGEEIIKKAYEYLEGAFKKEEVIPTIAGLALHLKEFKIPRQKIYEYAEKDKEFGEIVEVLQAIQEKRLISGGLLNKLNPFLVKLLLSAKHGYIEKGAMDLTSGGKPLLDVLYHDSNKKNSETSKED